MRVGMAVAAIGHGGVFGLVAEGAIKLPVFCLALAQLLEELAVAGAAIFGRGIIRVDDVQRAMRLVTAQAIFIGHECRMRLMTGQAFLDLFVLARMTEGAVLLGMFARELGELVAFLGMTGFTDGADRRDIIDGNVKRGMWISVTAKTDGTISQGKMFVRRGVMAHGTLGNGLLAKWKVL